MTLLRYVAHTRYLLVGVGLMEHGYNSLPTSLTKAPRLVLHSCQQKPDFGADSGLSTAFGGLMTGMLGVGIGEVVIPQLVKKNGVPLPVAAGTSVLVVFLNAVVAAGTQIGGIVARGGEDVPWNLIAFIVPGVVIGGQLAPRMQGRLSQRTMEKILGGVFGFVGATFATISVESLLAATAASTSLP